MDKSLGLDDEIDPAAGAKAGAVEATIRLAARARTVRTIGLIHLVNAGVMAASAGLFLAFPATALREPLRIRTNALPPHMVPVALRATLAAVALVCGWVDLMLGLGLRGLRPSARLVAVVLGTLSALGVFMHGSGLALALATAPTRPCLEQAYFAAVQALGLYGAIVLCMPASSTVFGAPYREFDAQNAPSRPGLAGRDIALLATYLGTVVLGFGLKVAKVFWGT